MTKTKIVLALVLIALSVVIASQQCMIGELQADLDALNGQLATWEEAVQDQARRQLEADGQRAM
jgi:hypothetical protein